MASKNRRRGHARGGGGMSPAWIALGLSAAGIVALAYAAPRAKAAENEPAGHRTWQLWSCPPVSPTDCRKHGSPLGKTACELDMASLVNVLPKGSRVACVQIIPLETKR